MKSNKRKTKNASKQSQMPKQSVANWLPIEICWYSKLLEAIRQ